MIQYNKADALNKAARAKGVMVDSDRSVNNRARATGAAKVSSAAELNAKVRAKGTANKASLYRTK